MKFSEQTLKSTSQLFQCASIKISEMTFLTAFKAEKKNVTFSQSFYVFSAQVRCVEQVERRGLAEVGIYRVPG